MAYTLSKVEELAVAGAVLLTYCREVSLVKAADIMSIEEQSRLLMKADFECFRRMSSEPYPSEGVYCNRTWDNVMCWMEAPVGTVVRQHCPSYISRFDSNEYATKTCMSDGTWYFNPQFNKTWTNYTACPSTETPRVMPKLVAEHMPNIQLLSNIGYGVSLGALLLAVVIMLCCRRLRSKSNVLHVNLFFAFILRAGVCFLRLNLLVEGLGLPADVERLANGRLGFLPEGTHWQCKLLFTVFHYSLGACYMWIFAEGIYLHMLVYKTLWTERHGVKPYIAFGWASPLVFLAPWVVVRAACEDELCWNTHPTPQYYWIMKGPIVASIVINFSFFVNIVRILTVRASHRNDENRYRKLAKFTLVLIPLFGVMYIVFVAFPPELPETVEIPYLYAEMFINSTQGFMLALLFCFLNEEVHLELKKIWARHKMRRRDSYLITRSWVFTTSAQSRRKGSTMRQGHDYETTVTHSAVSDRMEVPKSKMTTPVDDAFQEYELKKMKNGKPGRRKLYPFNRKYPDATETEQTTPLNSDSVQNDESQIMNSMS